jgi:hypothetical protein
MENAQYAETRPPKRRSRGAARPNASFEARIEGVSIEVLSATVFGPARLSVDGEDGGRELEAVRFRVDRGPWQSMRNQNGQWVSELPTRQLVEGPHTIEVAGLRGDGLQMSVNGAFRVARHAL